MPKFVLVENVHFRFLVQLSKYVIDEYAENFCLT